GLELAGPAASDIRTTVTELRGDGARARLALAEHGLGVAHAGADPLRPPRRVNPRPRYRAMEEHFAATGRGEPGAVMMNSTAAMQVNLEAGPGRGWAGRVARGHRVPPPMGAGSARPARLPGRESGGAAGLPRAGGRPAAPACRTVPGCVAPDGAPDADPHPASAWARCALRAPVAFVTTECGDTAAVRSAVPFERWASGEVRLGGRVPTAADLDTHL